MTVSYTNLSSIDDVTLATRRGNAALGSASDTDSKLNRYDTIFALATPAGKSGVAVFRLSGGGAGAALQKITNIQLLEPRKAIYSVIHHPISGTIIDHALALYFPAPHSFTGEEVVELHTHGSLAVIREIMAVLSGMERLRPAERGEFARRAYLNGKMDLIEAEGLADLIEAETSAQKAQALRQMGGNLSNFYNDLRVKIITALAHLEAYIDFPDEEIPESVFEGLAGQVRGVQSVIAAALDDHRRGERIRDGVHIVILGAPNAGKSSLLNALTQREAAIVSERAGTTRDVIEIHMEFAGYPAILMDTAGIRESSDDIESEGIRRALARAESADITLVLFEGVEPDVATAKLVDERTILVATKSDMSDAHHPSSVIPLSTKTGQGVDALLKAIETRIVESFSGEGAMITRSRHRSALNEAESHLIRFHNPLPLELKCEELRRAAVCIGQITGKIAVDDVLDVVFRQFCIGK